MKKVSNEDFKNLQELPSINKIKKIIQILRDPIDGCPWDIKQNYKSLAPYSIEEAYELVNAIEKNDISEIKNELGDLLLQVTLISQIASENDDFTFDDVAEAISEKIIRRHPQIFDKDYNKDDLPHDSWERIKNLETLSKNVANGNVLDNIETNIPAMLKSIKIQKRASSLNFDWDNNNQVMKKVDEELNELKEALDKKDKGCIEDELGDLFFTLINLSRHLKLDPEQTLRKSNDKFISRFNALENILDEMNLKWHDLNNNEFKDLWEKAKIITKRS